MEPNHLTVRQIHLKKPGLFGKLVLCNRPQGVRSQKTQVNLWFAVCLNQRNKSVHIFFHCIESHCVESNRIVLHRNRSKLYRVASLAASYECFSVLYHWSYHCLCIEMCIASASVMEMHIPVNIFWLIVNVERDPNCFFVNSTNNFDFLLIFF